MSATIARPSAKAAAARCMGRLYGMGSTGTRCADSAGPSHESGARHPEVDMSEGSMNLTVPRGDRSVWDRPRLADTLSTYDQERWASAAVGAGLALVGARRGGVAGG